MEKAFGDIDWGESSAAYIDILTNASFFEMSKEELESLHQHRQKPYFARIDFQHEDSKASWRSIILGRPPCISVRIRSKSSSTGAHPSQTFIMKEE